MCCMCNLLFIVWVYVLLYVLRSWCGVKLFEVTFLIILVWDVFRLCCFVFLFLIIIVIYIFIYSISIIRQIKSFWV